MSAANDAAFQALQQVTTATLTTVLLRKGLRNVWIRGAFPFTPQAGRSVGRAFTLRFIPAREDLATPESWSSSLSTRAAIGHMTLCTTCTARNGHGASHWLAHFFQPRSKSHWQLAQATTSAP